VNVVPHTHWDREWYRTFQDLRLVLVEVLDHLLDDLAADPGLGHFLLDGQVAVVDDYLELRPERADELCGHLRSGRLATGPWYTLPDEFLVSGETLVRDLELGMDRADELVGDGGAMPVGYLPDTFGHVAQMPQLLAWAGLAHAVVWRGVPAAVDRTAFWWSSPDGTTVRAEYLPTGYGNGARMPEDAGAFLSRLTAWIESVATIVGDDPVLLMNGTDHLEHQKGLASVLAAATAASDGRFDLRLSSLHQHVVDAPIEGLPQWEGELRSSARASLLPGVTSNRVDVRQAAARAERVLEQEAEPLWAAFAPAGLWPGRALELAWLAVVRNAAHDSVCACSADEVVDEVRQRYAEARQIGEGLRAQGLRLIGAALAGEDVVAVNTLARTRGGLVRVTRPGHQPGDGEQLVSAVPPLTLLHTLPAVDAVDVLEAELDVRPPVHGVEFVDAQDGDLDVHLRIDLTQRGRFPAGPSVDRLRAVADAQPDRIVRLHLADDARRDVLVRVDGVPGFGWAPVVPAAVPPVTASGRVLSNGLVAVEVDATAGTFSIDGHAGLGRLIDDGDAGDTYNHCPPDHDLAVGAPEEVAVSAREGGPLQGTLLVDARYRIPVRVDDTTSARVGARDLPVSTVLELRAGEPFVRVTISIENRSEDHRLRAWFPLPSLARTSSAGCAFATVTRGLEVEDGVTESGVATFPSRRFVQAGGLTVTHEGLPEYELVDVHDRGAHAMAITLLRATRFLSRGPMRTRRLPAGPVIELAGAQVPGHHVLRYAVALGDVDPYAFADDVWVDLGVARGAGMGTMAAHHQALDVCGAEVSSLRRRRGRLELRAFNPRPTATTLTIAARRGDVVDLRGRAVRPFTGSLPLGPFTIVTVALDEG
jgi:mannosylglycerate hydrolase